LKSLGQVFCRSSKEFGQGLSRQKTTRRKPGDHDVALCLISALKLRGHTPPFFGNPLTQESRAIREWDALEFAKGEKVDRLPIDKHHFLKVQDNAPAFLLDRLFYRVQMFHLNPSAHAQYDRVLAANKPLDLAGHLGPTFSLALKQDARHS
jgi:hypothetical protein